jgi:hypothetical protein
MKASAAFLFGAGNSVLVMSQMIRARAESRSVLSWWAALLGCVGKDEGKIKKEKRSLFLLFSS